METATKEDISTTSYSKYKNLNRTVQELPMQRIVDLRIMVKIKLTQLLTK